MTTFACHTCDVPPMTGDEALLHTHKPGHVVVEVPAPELWVREMTKAATPGGVAAYGVEP